MNHDLITRLVVGEPRTVVLGRAVRQKIERSSATALRWSHGRWLDERGPRFGRLARWLATRQPQARVVGAPARKVQLRLRPGAALFAAGAALLIGALAMDWHALRGRSIEPGALAVAALSSVRVLHSTYAPPPAASEPAPREPAAFTEERMARAAMPPLPFAGPADFPATPTSHRSSAPAAPRQAVQAAKSLAPVGKQARWVPSTPASARQQANDVPAVVLDEAAPRRARSPVADNPSETSAAPAPPTSSAAPLAAMAAASAPAAERAPAAAAELVAITPDGKLAVFTDPQTGLPRQFQLGEQLPGGDILRSIDARAGRALSSSKEYRLD